MLTLEDFERRETASPKGDAAQLCLDEEMAMGELDEELAAQEVMRDLGLDPFGDLD